MSASILNDDPQSIEKLQTIVRLMTWIREIPQPERSHFLAAISECSDELQSLVLRMLDIVKDLSSTPTERQRAISTIADALFLNPAEEDGRYGMDLAASEAGAAQRYEHVARHVQTMDSQEAAFAMKLRELMDVRHISQQELASRVGCSQPAISQMLNRKCRPQKRTIMKLAEALEVHPRDLWPDIEVAEILDIVASFQRDDYVMPEAEAAALRETGSPNPSALAGPMPKRRN